MADPRYAQFASSGPTGPDAAFWDQRVYFNGVPRRRREIVPTLIVTPGMTERAAMLLLASAQIADGTTPVQPPTAWFDMIPAIYPAIAATPRRRRRFRRSFRRASTPIGLHG